MKQTRGTEENEVVAGKISLSLPCAFFICYHQVILCSQRQNWLKINSKKQKKPAFIFATGNYRLSVDLVALWCLLDSVDSFLS